MKCPELVTATQGELDEILALAKTTFPDRQYLLLERVLGTLYVMQALQNAKTSIKRFRQMLFGARTEHKRNVLKGYGGAGETPMAPATRRRPQRPRRLKASSKQSRAHRGTGATAPRRIATRPSSSSTCPL